MNPLDRIKRRQQRAAAAAEPVAAIRGNEVPDHKLDHYQAAVDTARSALASIPTLGGKAEYKRTALAGILPFVREYVERGDCYPNSVAVEAMIWLMDTGDIGAGLQLALHLIAQGCHRMPRRFDANLPTFACRAVYDWANGRLAADLPVDDVLENLIGSLETGRWDVHPLIASMMYAMAAKHAERAGDYARAVLCCEQAKAVNPDGHGVKTLLERCRRALRKIIDTGNLEESRSRSCEIPISIEEPNHQCSYFGVSLMNIRKGFKRVAIAHPHRVMGEEGQVENISWASSDPTIADVRPYLPDPAQPDLVDPLKINVVALAEGIATIQFNADGSIGDQILIISSEFEVTVTRDDTVSVDIEVGAEQPA